ncbi:MAG: histidinol-phosphatase [Bacteroidales bacterium]|nr:histidinol-phosphatase [Bacteroidales bacterium]
MKNQFLRICFSVLVIASYSQERKILQFADIKGYITLKGDFHLHTPFSDGTVWPTDRVIEAWTEGLDVIAITDHIEYKPNKKDVSTNHNRPYEIALEEAQKRGIMLIKGAEITRSMPPGHLNAYFIDDINRLEKPDFMDVVNEVKNQNGFLIWNHPGWKAQQPDTTQWFEIHTKLLEMGILKGIEIVNYKEYYPIVFKWAIEKNLCLFGNSDAHSPINFEFPNGRPVTLVFAQEKTQNGLRKAIENQQTLVWFRDTVFGFETWLEPFFEANFLKEDNVYFSKNGRNGTISLTNFSSVKMIFQLEENTNEEIKFPNKFEIPPLSTILLNFSSKKEMKKENKISVKYKVTNWLSTPEKSLVHKLII